jgi:hypothetical protein
MPTGSLVPPIFYVAKKWQLKDRRFPIGKNCSIFLLYGHLKHNFDVTVDRGGPAFGVDQDEVEGEHVARGARGGEEREVGKEISGRSGTS